jgi:opacity protein-like surface antigen
MHFTTGVRRKSISAALFFLLCAVTTPAFAEWFADLYGGGAYTPRSDVTLVIRPPGMNADHTFHNVKWNPSGTFGARAGYWFARAPWYGIGLDLFRFNADIPSQTIDTTILGATAPATLQAIDFSVTAIGFDVVRLRYPLLASSEYPQGRLQPYVTAGPALFRTKVTNKGNGELTTRSASDSSWGYKLGGGLAWQLTPGAAIFGEYRYTHYRAEPVLQGAITGSPIPMPFTLNTHHLVAGLSFSF